MIVETNVKTQTRAAGFGLVEVLVVSVILGLMSIAFSQLFFQANKGAKRVEGSVEFTNLIGTINLVLNNQDICSGALKDTAGNPPLFQPPATNPAPPNPATYTVAVDHLNIGNTTVVKLGDQGSGDLQVVDLSLTELDPTKRSTSTVAGVTSNRYVANLHVGAERVGSQQPKKKDFPLILLVHQTNFQVVGCGLSPRTQLQTAVASLKASAATTTPSPCTEVGTTGTDPPCFFNAARTLSVKLGSSSNFLPPSIVQAADPTFSFDYLLCNAAEGWALSSCEEVKAGSSTDAPDIWYDSTGINTGCHTNDIWQHGNVIKLYINCIRLSPQ